MDFILICRIFITAIIISVITAFTGIIISFGGNKKTGDWVSFVGVFAMVIGIFFGLIFTIIALWSHVP
jgi:hypothetical protein